MCKVTREGKKKASNDPLSGSMSGLRQALDYKCNVNNKGFGKQL